MLLKSSLSVVKDLLDYIKLNIIMLLSSQELEYLEFIYQTIRCTHKNVYTSCNYKSSNTPNSILRHKGEEANLSPHSQCLNLRLQHDIAKMTQRTTFFVPSDLVEQCVQPRRERHHGNAFVSSSSNQELQRQLRWLKNLLELVRVSSNLIEITL